MWIEKKYMFFKSFIRKSFSIALKGRNKIFMGEIYFSQNQLSTKYTNFDEWKGRGEKIWCTLIFCFSYSTDCPIQKRVSVFLWEQVFQGGVGGSVDTFYLVFFSHWDIFFVFVFFLLFFIIMVLSNNATKICEITSKLVVLW